MPSLVSPAASGEPASYAKSRHRDAFETRPYWHCHMSLEKLPNELVLYVCERLPGTGLPVLRDVARLRLVSKRFGFLQGLWYLVPTADGDSEDPGAVLYTSRTLAGRREGPQYRLAYGCRSFELRGYRAYEAGRLTRGLCRYAYGHGEAQAGYEIDGKLYGCCYAASEAFDALVAGAYARLAPSEALADFLRAPGARALHASPARFPELDGAPDPALVRRIAKGDWADGPESKDGSAGDREGEDGCAEDRECENCGEAGCEKYNCALCSMPYCEVCELGCEQCATVRPDGPCPECTVLVAVLCGEGSAQWCDWCFWSDFADGEIGYCRDHDVFYCGLAPAGHAGCLRLEAPDRLARLAQQLYPKLAERRPV
jgi:hypothetical protein